MEENHHQLQYKDGVYALKTVHKPH